MLIFDETEALRMWNETIKPKSYIEDALIRDCSKSETTNRLYAYMILAFKNGFRAALVSAIENSKDTQK